MDPQLARALNAFTMETTSCHSRMDSRDVRAFPRDKGEVGGAMLDLPPLTSENETKWSGAETRTLNLADSYT